MGISIRRYSKERFCTDFFRVINFLQKYGAKSYNCNWHWARWEWLLGHSMLDLDSLPRIGLFELDNEIVGLATHDMRLGSAYIICNPNYENIKHDMLLYAEKNLSENGISGIYIDDKDATLIGFAAQQGFYLSDVKEYVSALDCSKGKFAYDLSDEYTVTDYSESKDINKYFRVMWKGFDHEGEPPAFTEDDIIDKPHFIPELAVFIMTPDGEYAAHCGTWYDPKTREAYVEPVVTIPEYRKRGFGKAAVYESINRCIGMGAKTALVISNQQFYHQIGFKEISVQSLWKKILN